MITLKSSVVAIVIINGCYVLAEDELGMKTLKSSVVFVVIVLSFFSLVSIFH